MDLVKICQVNNTKTLKDIQSLRHFVPSYYRYTHKHDRFTQQLVKKEMVFTRN